MKKVLTALVLFVTAFTLFGLKTQAAGTGNLVVHFKAWDVNYDYSLLGSHGWNGTTGKLKDGVDSFGAYWNFDNIAIPDTPADMGFIAVEWTTGTGPNWDKKLTGDVMISTSVLQDGKTTHVYVFQGTNAQAFAADPDKVNVLVVYYDPANAYEETIGVHHWGMTVADPAWASPKPFGTAGKALSGYDVKGIILAGLESWAGLLVYAGSDATKKTGDINPAAETPVGQADVVYVVNAGDAKTDNTNVFRDYEDFANEAFSFKLKPFTAEGMTGTFAQNPTDIYVETSAPITSPYPTAVDKDAARAQIESWFTVKEKTGATTYGPALEIERVDFALSATTLNTFVVVLKDSNKLDNTKEYEVFFDLGYPEEALPAAKNVEVTLKLTAPANTPNDAVLSVAGGFNEWTPGATGYTATKVGNVYTVTFEVSVQDAWTVLDYKWTRGAWANEEFVASNRSLVIPNNVDEIVFEDTVEAWADINAPQNKYAAPVRSAQQNLSASMVLVMDTAAPELTFISPAGIVGKPAAERIIEVEWGKPFDQNLFPGYRVIDDRDGDITPLVFVPKGEFSKIDTSKEGDYTIMLQVEDKWGNVTQQTFIFRVVKK